MTAVSYSFIGCAAHGDLWEQFWLEAGKYVYKPLQEGVPEITTSGEWVCPFCGRGCRRLRKAVQIEETSREAARREGISFEEWCERAKASLMTRHQANEDGTRCSECGMEWPCDNEVMWLRGLSRGLELAKEHGW